jgi:hypothetical protein
MVLVPGLCRLSQRKRPAFQAVADGLAGRRRAHWGSFVLRTTEFALRAAGRAHAGLASTAVSSAGGHSGFELQLNRATARLTGSGGLRFDELQPACLPKVSRFAGYNLWGTARRV